MKRRAEEAEVKLLARACHAMWGPDNEGGHYRARAMQCRVLTQVWGWQAEAARFKEELVEALKALEGEAEAARGAGEESEQAMQTILVLSLASDHVPVQRLTSCGREMLAASVGSRACVRGL